MSGEAYAGRDWALAEAVPPGLLRDLLTALPHLAHEVNLALSCDTSYDGAARECFMMLVGVFRHLDDGYQPRCLPSIHFEGSEPGDLAHDSPGNRLAWQLVQDEEDSR